MSTIILDFDYTLLDTAAFSVALAQSLGITREQWLLAYNGFVQDNGYFSAKDFLQGVPEEQRKAFMEVTQQTWQFLYPDTAEFFKKVLTSGQTIVILTFGDHEWQTAKVNGANLPQGLTVEVVNDRKVNHLSNYASTGIVVVDDRALELTPIGEHYPDAKLFWMCRPGAPHSDQVPTVPYTKVASLLEINF